MSNWRDYQRENNRQQNGRPAEERQNGNRMSVAKNVSGKMNIYMEYLNRWGRKKFLNCYNERYDQHIPDHVTKMSDFYQAFKNSSEFIALQEECRIYNSNTTDVLQNKATLAKHRREERHRRPDEYEQRRTEHVRNLQEARNRAFIAMPVTLGDVFTKEDQAAWFMMKKGEKLANMDSFFQSKRDSSRNPFVEDNYEIHLISVMPYTYTLKKSHKQISCYPAEISICTWNLKNGIRRHVSRIVQMDHNWFYGPGRLDQTIENDRNEFYELSRISDISNEEGDSPCDVFYWMHAELEREPYATIVCDKWQFNYVYYGLKLLATYTGHNAMNFFKERIASRMLPIQDFTVNLLEVSPLNKPRDERWSEESIEKQFKFNRIIARNDLNSYCSFHERFGSPTRHYCCMAQATRLLHNFFRILRANRLQGFDYSPPVHDLCIEEQDPRLPPVLESPMFTRAYLESQDEEEEENHGYEGGDERPETPDHYDFEEGDGSDDDDEDDGRGVYRVNAMVPRHDEDQSRFISRSTHYPIYPADNSRDVPSPAPRRRYEEDEAPPPPPPPQRPKTPVIDPSAPLPYTEHHHPSNWEIPEIFDVIPREDAAKYWRIARRPPKEFRLIDLRIDD